MHLPLPLLDEVSRMYVQLVFFVLLTLIIDDTTNHACCRLVCMIAQRCVALCEHRVCDK